MRTVRYIALFAAILCLVFSGSTLEAQVFSNIGDSARQSCGTSACNSGGGPLASGKFGKRLMSIGTGFDGGCSDGQSSCGLSSSGGGILSGSAAGGGLLGGKLGSIGSGGIRSKLSDRAGGRLGGGAMGGKYLSVMAGFSFLDDQQSTGFNRQVDSVFNDGSVVGGAIGTTRGRARYEIEYALRNNSPETIDFNGNSVPASTVGGKILSHSGMFNMALDLSEGSAIKPYVGAGVGFSFIDSDLEYGSLPARLNGQDSSFAYQFFAGLSKTTAQGGDLFIEYRFFSAVNPKLNRFGGPGIDGGPQDIILLSEYDAHNLLFGFRKQF